MSWGSWLGIGCGVLVGLLFTARSHRFQRLLIYLSYAKPPLFLFPLHYEKEGFHSMRKIKTPDNQILGSWLYYNGFEKDTNKNFILYLHGNAGTRGQVR